MSDFSIFVDGVTITEMSNTGEEGNWGKRMSSVLDIISLKNL